jgi:hypothetical protein
MFKFKKYVQCIAVSALTIFLNGCELDDEDEDGDGYYQYVNLVPQSPSIEFVVEDTSLGEIEFTGATEYESVSTGTYDIEFNQILPNSDDEGFIDDESLKVTSNTVHSLILYGDASSPSSYELELDVSEIYDDDFEDGYAIVQFVNLTNADETVDIYLLDADESLVNKTVNYSLTLADTSGDVEISEGDYKIVFTESGTDTILAQKNDISIDEAEALSYILVSYQVAGYDDARYSIVELSDSGSRTLTNQAADGHLRVANGISNTGGISIATGDSSNILESYLELGSISSDVTISISDSESAESTTVYIVDSEDETQLDSTTLSIYADDQILLVTAGDASGSVSLNESDEDLRVIDTHGKILLSHAIYAESDETLEVLIIEEGGNPDSYDAELSVSYLDTETHEIEAGSYDIYIYNSSDELLIEYTLYDLAEGDVVNLVTTDFETSGSPYQIAAYFN